MTTPIALQLYSVREALSRDFTGVMKRVADIGYVGVEPAFGDLGTTPEKADQLFRELGFEVPSAHAPLPVGEDKNKVLDFMAALGSNRLFSGKGAKDFETINLIKQTCDLFNEAHAVAAENGISFGIHNHWWEFQQVDGRYVYQVMLEHLDPGVLFQLDTYWIQAAGVDPTQVVREFGARAPSLHIKDGPAVRNVPQVAVGEGVLDFPSIIQAAEDTAEWLVVELDDCATDMLEAVNKSYSYLVGEGLARGRKG
jgi:sugar phosphate isomerase/epimerase